MIAELRAWLRSKNITSHAIVATVVLVASAVTTDQQVRDFLIGLLQAHPKLATGIFSLAAIILKYSHSSSAAGKVAAAENVLASPNPPTEAAVAAANTTPRPNLSSTIPLVLLAALLIPFAMVGCTSWERSSFQTLAASKAVIDQAQVDYESGKLPHSKAVYDAVNKAKGAQTLAVNAMVTYEGMKAQGAHQTALQAAQTDVAIALEALPAILADIKALYTKQTAAIYVRPGVTRATMEWRLQ